MIGLYLIFYLLLSGCAQNQATGQRQRVLLSPEQEQDIGSKEHPKVLKAFGGIYEKDELNNYVSSLGEKLAKLSEQPNIRWKFTVLDSPLVNAFALPGGYVYISRGLLSLTNDESELASVLGHEIAHITARHTAQRHAKSTISEIGLNILDNSYNWIKPNKELTIKEKLILLNEIYNLNIISDYFIYNIHENNEWSFINHIITFNIFIPIILLRNNNIKPINIDYNKYISKCIIYIHNSKLLTYSKVNTSILSTLYAIIEGYYKGLVSKTIVINYINYYNIPLIISEKFLKYFSDINKNKVKIFY